MKRVVRAAPVAVLTAIVVAAIGTRLSRPRVAPAAVAPSLTGANASSSSSASSLVGPSPPPSAFVPPNAARMIHGSPRHLHRASARGPRDASKIAWRTEVGGPIAAQVTVAPDDKTLYVASLDGHLTALARDGGTKRWSVALGDRVYSTPLISDDGTVYVGSDAKKLFAISPAGTVLFRLEVDGEADSGATFAKDGTIVFAAGSYVHAARKGGDLAWRFAAKGKVFTAPAVTDDGLVVFGSQDDHVYALREGGALAWAVDLGADVDGAPAVADDGAVYVGTDRGDVVRLDARGKIVWRTDVGGFVRGALSIARNGDVLVGTYGPAPRLVRLAPDGTIRGAFPVRGTGAKEFGIHGGPLEDADGTLFFGAQDDAAYAIATDGTVRFRYATKGDVDAPLTLLSDGALVVPSEDGSITLLLP